MRKDLRKKGPQPKWRSFKCGHCNGPFTASRDDAIFCGPSCRKAEQRIRMAVTIALSPGPLVKAGRRAGKAVRK